MAFRGFRVLLESSLENRVVTFARLTLRAPSKKLKSNADTGWPDRMFLFSGGRAAFIEFKKPGEIPKEGELTKQTHIIERLRNLGFAAEFHDTYEGAVAFLTYQAALTQAEAIYREACTP